MDDRTLLQRETDDIDRHVAQIAEEFRAGFDAVASIDRPAAAVFGSARLPQTDRWCTLAVETAAGFAREGFAVVTGGGPGVMEAANRGAREAGGPSVGCNIVLPQEQKLNPYLDRKVTFRYFFVRKLMLVKYSYGFIAAPAGFLNAASNAWTLSGICCAEMTSIEIANANAASMKVSSRVIAMPRKRNPPSRGSASNSGGKPDVISCARSCICLVILPQSSAVWEAASFPLKTRSILDNFMESVTMAR